MNIYIGNLPSSMSESKIKGLFEQYGNVTSVKIIMDKLTGQPRGFAFVEMPSSDEANNAIASLNGQNVEGQTVKVNEARPPESRPRSGGFGGGNGGNRRY